MAIMDVPQADYWHVDLAGWRSPVQRALDVFPSPVITEDKGIFRKNIRAYHSGGAVLIDGKPAGVSCVESQFPSAENVSGVLNYLPVGSIGFTYSKLFEHRFSAFNTLRTFLSETSLSFLGVRCLVSEIIDNTGRKYWPSVSDGYELRGVVADRDVKKIMQYHSSWNSSKKDVSVGELRFSLNPGRFDFDSTFLF